MKNKVLHLFISTAILAVSSAFVNHPSLENGAAGRSEPVVAAPAGGAFVVFAGKFGGELSKKEMAGQTEVKVDGCAKGARIFEFTLYITKGGQRITLKGNSNILSSEIRAQLNALNTGDAFEFKEAKAYLSNSKDTVDVHSRKFIVV
jgi:tripartite-type tricarboxylate transporter receptor subunit TctC